MSHFFPGERVVDHLPLLEPLNDAEKANLSETIVRRHFQAGEQLLAQGMVSIRRSSCSRALFKSRVRCRMDGS